MRTLIRNSYILWLALLQPLAAQVNFNVSSVDGSKFREVSVFFNATNNQGIQYRDFTPGDFTVVEDGVEKPVLRVSCQDPQTPPLSVTYLFDISNSMTVLNKVNIAKAAAHSLASLFDYPPARAGILGFDDSVYIHQEYTTNKQLILDKINNLTTYGANTHIYNAFMDPVKGAIAWTKDKPGEKFIVILTDEYRRLTVQEERDIYNEANKYGIRVISLILQPGQQAPSLELISNRTGGSWYRNVTDTTQAANIFADLGYKIYVWPPCEMVYLSDGCETTRSATITLRKGGSSDTETRTYTVPANKIVTLRATPFSVDFGSVPAGQKRTIDVVLRAENGPITVQYIQTTTSSFFVKNFGGSAPPFTIPMGGTRTLTIEYSSSGSTRILRQLHLVSDAPCQDQVILAGGLIADNSLHVEHPNGGESYFVSDVLTYRYSGVASATRVNIEYSTNAGATWNIITQGVTNFQRNWITANTPSDSCLALIYTDDDRSNTTDSSWLPFHPSNFTAIDIAGMSSILAVGRSDGRVNIYYPYNGTLARMIQAHTGAVHAVTFSEDAQWFATAGNDRRIKVFSATTGDVAFQSTQFGSATYSAAFSPDGAYLAGSDNGTVKLWRTSDWQELWSSPNQASANGAVVIDPRLRWVASTRGNDVVLLDFTNGSRIRSYTGHSAAVRSLDVTEDGWYIVSGGNDNTIRLWNTFLNTQVQALTSHSGNVNSVRFATGGLQVVSASDDNTVRVWNIKRGNILYTFNSHSADVQAAVIGRQIGRVFSVGDDRVIRSFTYTPSLADRSDGLWKILAKITNIVGETPEFDTLLCPGEFSERTIWVRNVGNQPIIITDITISGSDASQFNIVNGPTIPPDLVLQPEDSVSFTLRFEATSRGTYNATLDFITDNPALPELSINLNGTKDEAAMELSESLVAFGEYYHCSMPDTASVIITNTGNVDITAGLNGSPVSGPFTMLSSFPIHLSPGASDTLWIACAPDAEGDFHTVWEFTGMPCDVRVELDLTASFVNSAPLTVPDPLVFDYTSVGESSGQILWLHNRTQVPINVTELIISGPPFSLTDPSLTPFIVPALDSIEVSLTFTPSVEGTSQGTLVIISDSPCNDTVTVRLEGSSSLKPSIVASIPPFTRLTCPDEQSDEQSLTLRNTGGQALEISAITIAGPHAADFTIQNPPSMPLVIQPNGSETVTVRFQPLDIGDRVAEIVITSNAENEATLRVPLSGRRDEVAFTVAPDFMDFGERYHCTMPISGNLTVSNTGNIPISVSLLPSSVPSWLTIQPGLFPLSFDAGAQATVAYTIDAPAYGSYEATLEFNEPACNTEASARISFGYADSKPAISNAVLDFGTLNVGTSDTRTVTLSSAIGNDTRISSVVIPGAVSFVSRTDPQSLPATVAPGGQLPFTFTYAPLDDHTLQTEVLLITDSPCNDTLRVMLIGTGKSAGTVVSLQSVTASVGETIRIPITLEQSENLTLAGATSFAADIEFNGSMLWILGVESAFGDVQFNTRVAAPVSELHIEVTGTQAPPLGVIAELVCLVALGDSDYTPLAFRSFEWLNTNVSVSTIDGALHTEGICRAGGNRFIGLSADVEIFQNVPNPFNPRTEIGFMLPQPMHVDLRVYNAVGKEVALLVKDAYGEGYHTAVFEGNGLPSGVYFAVLRAGDARVKMIRMLMTK